MIPNMKARDLRSRIDWTAAGDSRFSGIAEFFSSEWIIEPKIDGCRLRMTLGPDQNSIRSSVDRSRNFPHLLNAVVSEMAGTVLDGELLAPGPVIQTHTGTWTDSFLNASVALTNSNPEGSVATQKRFGKAQLHLFDILANRGDSTLHIPFIDRRQLLVRVAIKLRSRHPDCQVILVPQLPSSASSISQSLASGYEGVMIKSVDGPYEPGKRSKHWWKAKAFVSADAFICGYAPGMNGNTGEVGSLELGVKYTDGSVRPVAKVGNLTAAFRAAISASDGSLRPECYGMVIEFSTQGLTKSGRARHASMMRIRPDKSANECGEDQLSGFPRV